MRNRLRLCRTAVKRNSDGQKRSGQSTSARAAANAPPDSKTIFEQSDLRHFNIPCSRIPEDQAAGAGEDLLYSCMFNSQNTPRHSGTQAVDGVKHAVRLSQLQRLGGAIVFLPSRGLFPCHLRSSAHFQACCHPLLFDRKNRSEPLFPFVPGLFSRAACTAAYASKHTAVSSSLTAKTGQNPLFLSSRDFFPVPLAQRRLLCYDKCTLTAGSLPVRHPLP